MEDKESLSLSHAALNGITGFLRKGFKIKLLFFLHDREKIIGLKFNKI